jgi:hypothetical protein
MPIIILVPILQVVGFGIFLIPWITYLLYLASSGEITERVHYYTVEGVTDYYIYNTFNYTSGVKYSVIFLFFVLYWTSEFIIGMGQLIISTAVSSWYFSRDKTKIDNITVLEVCRTIIYPVYIHIHIML